MISRRSFLGALGASLAVPGLRAAGHDAFDQAQPGAGPSLRRGRASRTGISDRAGDRRVELRTGCDVCSRTRRCARPRARYRSHSLSLSCTNPGGRGQALTTSVQ